MISFDDLEKHVGGWFNEKEHDVLYKIVYDLPPLSKIVEIGPWRGLTTITMLDAIRDSGQTKSLLSIDYFKGDGRPTESAPTPEEQDAAAKALFKNIDSYKLNSTNNFKLVVSKSSEWFAQDNGKYDMFFIDGYHPIVASDMASAWPKLNPGGILVCHDYDVNSAPNQMITDIDGTGIPGHHCGVWLTSLWISERRP